MTIRPVQAISRKACSSEDRSGSLVSRWSDEGEASVYVGSRPRRPTATDRISGVPAEFSSHATRLSGRCLELGSRDGHRWRQRIYAKPANESMLVCRCNRRPVLLDGSCTVLRGASDAVLDAADDFETVRGSSWAVRSAAVIGRRSGLPVVEIAYAMNSTGSGASAAGSDLDRILRGHTPDAPEPLGDEMVRSPWRHARAGRNRNDLSRSTHRSVTSNSEVPTGRNAASCSV